MTSESENRVTVAYPYIHKVLKGTFDSELHFTLQRFSDGHQFTALLVYMKEISTVTDLLLWKVAFTDSAESLLTSLTKVTLIDKYFHSAQGNAKNSANNLVKFGVPTPGGD